MGEEIEARQFSQADFRTFGQRLGQETALVREIFASGGLSQAGPCIGLELEAWLIDRNFFPAPHNQDFLARLSDANVVAELSRFNIEINAPVETIAGRGLARMHEHLSATMRRCAANAHEDIDTVIAIGMLPTLREQDLTIETMTPSARYAALNRETTRLRDGAPVKIDIEAVVPGEPGFSATYDDVMLEAAATSLQLHLQLPPDRFSRAYNASIMLCAPLVAIAANSPFLFGQPLWHETRIPAFEQALALPRGKPRVTLGSGYAPVDPTELFAQNLADYPVLLPVCEDAPINRFKCLHLQNGTIWRWVRPLVGFDADATPHLRIEQRVLPSGPSVLDMMANAALYYGAVHQLANDIEKAEAALPFEKAEANFYACARSGLDAEVDWLGTRGARSVREVIDQLLPIAERGLRAQGMDEDLIDKYLSTIAMRLACGRTGAVWQLQHYGRHRDLYRLTAAYLENQRTGMPVHEWAL